MFIPRFPADGGIALRGIALFLEIHQYRGALLLFIQKPRQFLEADAVHIVRRNFPVLIQHDHIADRQAVPMVIRRAGAVEFLVQLFQQFRLRNAALSGRKIATVENLVIINPFLADSPMRSSKMLYRVFASVFSQLAREIIGHFASVENAQILKQYIVLPKAAAKDEIFFGFTWRFCLFSDFSV